MEALVQADNVEVLVAVLLELCETDTVEVFELVGLSEE